MDKCLVIKETASVGFRLDKEGKMFSRADDNTREFSVTNIRDRSDRFALKFEKPSGRAESKLVAVVGLQCAASLTNFSWVSVTPAQLARRVV